MWEEADAQVGRRRLGKPIPHKEDGRTAEDHSLPVNLAYRFPAAQPDKTRSAGELKQDDSDRYFLIATPIHLPT